MKLWADSIPKTNVKSNYTILEAVQVSYFFFLQIPNKSMVGAYMKTGWW